MQNTLLSASLLLCCALLGCSADGSTPQPADEEETPSTDPGGTDDTDTDEGEDDTDTAEGEDTDTAEGEDTDTAGEDTDSGAGPATSEVTGTYGTDAIQPIQAAYWIGQPGNPGESGGGPFVYLFSAPITCEQLASSSWLAEIPAGTQIMEMIIGATAPGTVTVAQGAGAGVAEVNYALAGGSGESRASSGTVTLGAITPGDSVDGTLDVTFPDGAATGSFHATWCEAGQEF